MGNTKEVAARVFTKAAPGVRTVSAVVTSGNVDRDGDIVDVKSLRFPLRNGGYVLGKDLNGTQKLDIPFLLNHSFDVEDMLGAWQTGDYRAATNDIVLHATMSTRDKTQDLLKLFDEDLVGNNFSITMGDFTYDRPYIFDAEVLECSFVFKGSNKDAKLLLVKSLLKGEPMAEIAETPAAPIDATPEVAATAPVDTVEAVAAPEVVAVTDSAEEPVEQEDADTPTAPAVEITPVESPAPTEVPAAQPTNEPVKETDDMADVNDIAVKQVKDTPEVEVVAVKGYSTREIRENFVDQFFAKAVDKDSNKLAELRSKAMEMSGIKSKEILGAGSGDDAMYLPTLVASDIIKAYDEVAGYAQGVHRLDITGQTLIDLPVLTGSTRFQRVGRGQRKPLAAPVLDSKRFEPREWAVIVPWYDYVQKQSKMAVYQLIVEFIAEAYSLTEDDIVINYAGGAVEGESTADPATGLVPILTTAGRVTVATDDTGAEIIKALATALGTVKGSGTIEVGTNRSTWLRVVTSTNGMGNFIANADGSVTLGGAGTLRPVFSDAFDDGDMVVGIRSQYEYVTNGGLATLFSQHALLEDAISEGVNLNLFQQDASALRAEFWAEGAPRRVESFALVQLPANS